MIGGDLEGEGHHEGEKNNDSGHFSIDRGREERGWNSGFLEREREREKFDLGDS